VRRIVIALTALGMVLTILAVFGAAQEKQEKPVVHQYVGASKCKTCHKIEAKGDQYTKWANSKHAKAYESLASEQSLAIGKEKGIDNPQTSDKCLVCHVTAFSAPAEQKSESYDMKEGVSCETCHGPGSDYKKMNIMKDIEAAKAAGLIIPTEATCAACHNDKSPTFKSFNFAEASKIIAHPNPAKAAK